MSGFYIVCQNESIKIQYGFVVDWGHLYDRSTFTHFLDESILSVEFTFDATKEDFINDINENILYLEKVKRIVPY